MNLENKVVLITGAGTGIGAASARYMARNGAALAVTSIVFSEARQVAREIESAGGKAVAIEADVTQPDQIDGAIERTVHQFGHLDVVVANAGIQRHQTDRDLFEMEAQEWMRTQEVNLTGVMLTCKAALARFVSQGTGGAIVIMSSITALRGFSPNVSYATAKSGLLGLNRHIAVHYAQHGIRCNALCPGALEQTPDWSEHPDPDGRKETMERAIPLGRLGTPDDIAPWVAFLASDAASYATGGEFVVDGGFTCK